MNPNVQLIDRAIASALSQKWKEAIKLNLELLHLNSEDIPALNRLAYAYLKTGNIPSAKTSYKKVLKLDKYNPIALKNLKWLSNLTKKDIHQDTSDTPSPNIFIEEPGKTKIVTLINAAPFRVLCNVMTAQKVELHAKKRTVEIRTTGKTYLGALPDDISHRLIKFMSDGNTYDAYIKNVQKNVISVFLRELKRSKKWQQHPSFTIVSLPPRKSTRNEASDKESTELEEEM